VKFLREKRVAITPLHPIEITDHFVSFAFPG
jgi:hypothetical protein